MKIPSLGFFFSFSGNRKSPGQGHGRLRRGAGCHRHDAARGLAHQRHEAEARARGPLAGEPARRRRRRRRRRSGVPRPRWRVATPLNQTFRPLKYGHVLPLWSSS